MSAHEAVTDFAQKLLEHLSDLVAPLAWLEEHLAPWRKELDASTEALIVWAWQHRFTLTLEAGEGFPAALQPVVQAFVCFIVPPPWLRPCIAGCGPNRILDFGFWILD